AVHDLDAHALAVAGGLHVDRAAGRRELDRVLEEMVEDLAEALAVGADRSDGRIARQAERHLLGERHGDRAQTGRLHQLAEIALDHLEIEAAGQHRGRVDEVLDHLALRVDAATERLHRLPARCIYRLPRARLAQDVDPALHRGQGRAQLVAAERGQLVLDPGRLFGHPPREQLRLEALPDREGGAGEQGEVRQHEFVLAGEGLALAPQDLDAPTLDAVGIADRRLDTRHVAHGLSRLLDPPLLATVATLVLLAVVRGRVDDPRGGAVEQLARRSRQRMQLVVHRFGAGHLGGELGNRLQARVELAFATQHRAARLLGRAPLGDL